MKGMQMHIDPDAYYPPADDELRTIAAEQTLARWRHEGRGPAFIRCGKRVLYKGSDILLWLKANKVEPHGQSEPVGEIG